MSFPVQAMICVICPHIKDDLRDLPLEIVYQACSEISAPCIFL